MKSHQDAVGQEIFANLQGNESYEAVERDDGCLFLSGGATSYLLPYTQWPAYQKRGLHFAKGRVLDVGAGAGRVSLELQKRGYMVTAIDTSPLAIAVCRKRGVRDARVLPFEKVDIFKPRSFDTVILYGNNFGLFRSKTMTKTLLRKLARITSAHAVIIAESNDPHQTKDPVHFAYHRWNRRRGRMPGQIRIRIRFRNYSTAWFDYLLVSKAEMRILLKSTGWVLDRTLNSPKTSFMAIIKKV